MKKKRKRRTTERMYNLLFFFCWGDLPSFSVFSRCLSLIILPVSYFFVPPSLAFCMALVLEKEDRSSVTTFRPPCRLTCGGSMRAPALALGSAIEGCVECASDGGSRGQQSKG